MKSRCVRFFVLAMLIALGASFSAMVSAQDEGDAWGKKKSSWLLLTPAERAQVQDFSEAYKDYLNIARSAMGSTREVIRRARAAGFTEFSKPDQVRPGARLIIPNRDRGLILAVIGSDPIVDGSRVVGTHQDSPHIELKPRPIYPAGGFALFKTKYYGGIKKYQWSNLPLALIGRIDTSDGRTVELSLGLNPGEPVFVIPDDAPHSDADLRTRTYTNVLQGEELDPVMASIPGEKESVAVEVTQLLTSTYKIKEEDLVSAELSLVPATHPADVGFDRGLIGSYGQDDRVSTYCAARAIVDMKGTPKFTALAYLSNFEEVGSVNNTGAGSQFLNSTFARLIGAQRGSGYNDLDLRRALHNSQVISADATDSLNPIFPSSSEPTNAARLGYGVAIKLYGEGFDPPSEFTAKIRALLDRNGIPWQTHMYKVDVGGGGTIGGFMSREDMEVIDFGVPLLSMHSPYEMSSKVDVWNFYRTMSVFYIQP
ncbi:MAG TPA: peptidase M18 [Verrucomicrobiae bacterium]|jgi:aspartyl aminopeptidase|nr:peptidase M18 [Verrucomicrobiae bacterium]